MIVTKRNGSEQELDRSKIERRISRQAQGLQVDSESLCHRVIDGVYRGVKTTEVDDLISECAANSVTKHPDYSILAARILVSRLHKETSHSIVATAERLYNYHHQRSGRHAPKISRETLLTIRRHEKRLMEAIDYSRDYEFSYFGYRTLERSYLLRVDGKIAERPQQLLMRVSVGIHGEDIESAVETYELMSKKYFTHASPTLFNAGTPLPQMSSCFLVAMKEDSIDGIFDTLKTCASISKSAGGIGIHVHNIRARGAYIAGTNGNSSGLVPMLKVYNDAARYVDQGGNKRPGAFAIYLEPWHADVFDFLDMRKNHGKEESRGRDLFYALWIPDLFMKRVEHNEQWTLFSPDEAPGLCDVYGDEFEALYLKYEKENRGIRTVKAQKLWYAILESQSETGTPFMLYKDACNRKTNQKNLGTIKSSNLCAEIVQYSDPNEVAVCNLASLALPTYVKWDDTEKTMYYDFQGLHKVAKVVTRNLNRIIDINAYPVPEAERSNLRHRPIAIGVQGLADVFLRLRLPYESEEAQKLNSQIFETIYHGALEASIELAAVDGTYDSFEGSPASKGQLQFDLWSHQPSKLWHWDYIKSGIARYGLRNSLLVAPMPTASTSQILGFNECFEPYTSNIYTRRVLSGEFQVVNQYLMKDLHKLGLWNDKMKNRIIADGGSIQSIPAIPKEIKDLYKTVWEMSQRTIINMAAARGPFIDQSQSLNIYIRDATVGKLTSMHFHGWKKGLKTGMYYLRTQAASAPIQFTVDQALLKEYEQELEKLDGTIDTDILQEFKYVPIEAVPEQTGKDEFQDTVRLLKERKKFHQFSHDDNENGSTSPNLKRGHNGSGADNVGKKKARRLSSSDYDIFGSGSLKSCSINPADGCEMCSG